MQSAVLTIPDFVDQPSDAPAAARGSAEWTRQLTERLCRGDENAFREFHECYFDRLYRYLLAVTNGVEHEARDAVQDAVIRVARKPRRFEDEELHWRWLRTVARNAARDRSRGHQRYFAALERLFVSRKIETAVFHHEHSDLRALLDESLAELSSPDRELIEAKYREGATLDALSAETGATAKAVESRLRRLRLALRERILAKLRTP